MKSSRKLKWWAPISLHNEKGIILLVGLIMLALVTVIGALSLKQTTSELKTSASYRTGVASFHLAEAAADYVREAMDQNMDLDGINGSDKTQVFTDGGTVTWDSSAILGALEAGATGEITVVSRGVGTNLADLTSRAEIGDSTQTIKLMIERGFPVPQIPSPITAVSNGTNRLDVEDSSLATGNESSGKCSNLHGFVWNSGQFISMEGGSLEGEGTTPPTPSHRQFNAATDDPIWADPVQLLSLVNELASRPGVVNISGSAPPVTLGTAANPQITVWDPGAGPTTTTAATTGYGILIVKAIGGGSNHLNFASTYSIVFHGLVIVEGTGELTLRTNSVIHGGVIAVSESTSSSWATHVDLENDSQLLYNCDSIAKYAGPLMGGGGYAGTSVAPLSWKQESP